MKRYVIYRMLPCTTSDLSWPYIKLFQLLNLSNSNIFQIVAQDAIFDVFI